MLLNLVMLNAGIAGGVVEGFAWAAVIGDAAVGCSGQGWWGVPLGFLPAAFHQRFVRLALTAAEVGFVAAEALEFHGAGLKCVSAEQGQVGFGLVGEAPRLVLAFVIDGGFEEVGFEAHDAAHAPFGVGHLAHEGAFVGPVGVIALAKFGAECVEVGGVFAGDDGFDGVDTVCESVL